MCGSERGDCGFGSVGGGGGVSNPAFKLAQMSEFRLLAQTNRFAVTPKRYIESTGAIGLISKAGNAGGTWAHSDIALEFCTWLEPRFKVYFFKEFQRLKREEAATASLEFHIERITDLVDETRNWLDTVPGQKPGRNRPKMLDEKSGGNQINPALQKN